MKNLPKLSVAIDKLSKNYILSSCPQHMETVTEILGLKAYYDYVKDNTVEHIKIVNVYHNFAHTEMVVLNCYEGALHEGLSITQTRTLVLAALFHDFDHTLGKSPDWVNIRQAIKGLYKAFESIPKNNLITETMIKEAASCIRATEYPYLRTAETLLNKLLRDADLMSVYQPKEQIMKIYEGLYVEHVIKHKTNVGDIIPILTFVQFGQQQQSFFSEIKWRSRWAQLKSFKRNFPQVSKDVVAYLNK